MESSAIQFEDVAFEDVASCVRHHVDAHRLKPMQLAAYLGLKSDRRIYYWLGSDPDSRKGVITSPAVHAWVKNIDDPAVKLSIGRAQFAGCGLTVGLDASVRVAAGQLERRATDIVAVAVDSLKAIQAANADGQITGDERPHVRAKFAELRAIIDQVDMSLDGTAPAIPPVRLVQARHTANGAH